MVDNIDIESLRSDLIQYFGTAVYYNPMATMDLIRVETASAEEIITIAIQNGFDLSKYEFQQRYR